MTPRAWLLSSWVVVGAAVLIAHAVVVFQVVRARDLPVKHRFWAVIPLLAPVLAWRDGRRSSVFVWVVLVVVYVVLRGLEGI